MTVTLTQQQQEAIQRIGDWYSDSRPAPYFGGCFRLFGPAGVGKTSLAREVPAALGLSPERVQYAAFTGKAASVLRRKGCTPASTLHSLVYMPRERRETRVLLAAAQAEREDALAQVGEMPGEHETITARLAQLEAEIQQLEREARTVGWEWNPDSDLADSDLLILDEVSMVDAKLAADIERYQIPVLVLGDPEQLEPVGGEGYYMDAAPDFALTEIHRQALESPVLELATRIRLSTDTRLGITPDDVEQRSLARAMDHDQIICWRNATRWSLVEKIRAKLGRPKDQVVAGDRIMCLTNNRTMGIFNGQQFTVMEARGGPLGPELELMDDDGDVRRVLAHADGFQGQMRQASAKSINLGGKGNRGLFTFANAITAHKAQGSEWSSVYVVNEAPDMLAMQAGRVGITAATASARRWLYTSTSRASDVVTVAVQR